MRFLHTSDWHLGRTLYERSLVEDQAHVLQQCVDLVVRERLDAVVIAGDIYDRPIPPSGGIQLLDWVLSELVLGARVPVILISGNHDSGERLSFGARLLSEQRLRIVSRLGDIGVPLRLEDRHGAVDFFGIPYSDPAEVRVASQEAQVHTHQEALEWCVAHLRARMEKPSVVLAHAYVSGGSGSESERPLAIGGKPFVRAETFAPFAYTALGHLHGRQSLGEGIQYCGSLLPYHFTERDVPKSVSIVELGADRKPRIEHVPLQPRRKLVLVTGGFEAILEEARRNPNAEDYVLVRRDYDRPRPEALQQLRQHYPNLVALEVRMRDEEAADAASSLRSSVRKSADLEALFSGFYEKMTQEPLTAPQAEQLARHLKQALAPEERA